MGQKLPGVYTAKKKDGTVYYRSSVTYQRKHISLGSFLSESGAHDAYREALRIINDTSVTLDGYSDHSPLAFEKWVVLLNFRDNRLYISNPIYIRPKFFQYFLSPHCVLKFDTDDLFYYSSHKIMQRGGHLFVSDYGMQTTITARYGIKNYAVCGRDYRFVNGDSTDFRYENIEIFNRYNGVSRLVRNGKLYYRAKIHIQGDYIIGTYRTEDEAAIAYNKAVDILKKAGVDKQFSPNYLEGLSPAVYADLYAGLKISSKITHYQKL